MDKKVKFFKALGDETRLKIVGYLLENDYCACDFAPMTEKDQTTISRHLRVLVEANVLRFKKKGRNRVYAIKDNEVRQTLSLLGIKGPKSKYCIDPV